MRTLQLLRRLTALISAPLAALILTAAPQARAGGGVPPDPDTTAIGFIQHVQIGRADCDSCPPRVCPGEPVLVTISGYLPSPCFEFRGFRELPVAAPFTVLQADFVADTCGKACPAVLVPFSASVSLPAWSRSSGSFVLRHQIRSCPDTTIDSTESRQYTYVVEPNCYVPPPLDSLVRSFVSFSVTPARPCPGDSLTLVMRKNGCQPCVHLSSLSYGGTAPFEAVVDWRPLCPETQCTAESLSTPIGAFAAGSYLLRFQVVVRVLGTQNPDSMITYTQRLGFGVGKDCPGGTCVEAWLPPPDNVAPVCAVTLPLGGVGEVSMPVRTGPAIWGAQGWLRANYPIRILDVNYAGSAPGTYVTWHRDGDLVRFVAFTTGVAPMIPSGRSDFLHLTIRADSLNVLVDPARAQLQGLLEQVAGRDGEGLPSCPHDALHAPPSLAICIVPSRDSCDANGDGRADVRDLVSMVRCLHPDTTGLGLRVCPDCNGDSLFNLSDLLCCARHILRAPHVPRDSTHASADVRVAFGAFRPDGAGWRVPVRINGAGALAGSLVRLRYPAERWHADVPVELASVTTPAGWMPLVDVEEPGVVQLAWLKLGEGETPELMFELALRPQGQPQSSDAISVEGADLVLPDGTTLWPADALPVASLISPLEPPPTVPASLELGPARPNPFNTTTRFSVALPRESLVDLTVHDVAGRVVATLARGRFAAGVREFTWDGTSARDGVYFVRLSVDGRVLSQRVALLRAGR